MPPSSPRKFKKILAANRGEIAIRIFRACTELGIRTVAIYSEEDLLSIHRYKADEAYLVGEPGDPIGAYLDYESIIRLAKRIGVDAIHPGYGFLSENAAFAIRCAEEGITFIGPSPKVLDTLGDKTQARKVAIEAGIPVVPGTVEPLTDATAVAAFGESHGYPLILKAAFGGGGRGMRVVRSPDDVEEAFFRATSEATKAFGRGAVFCERFIEQAKHIEVQILADGHGSCVHLFERDCSVQRRHQKVVEIAPAVTLGDSIRQGLYEASLRIAQSCGYTNAGTVEFLVDQHGGYYFIEVNPRIQVEHTVTEMITGRDLVQAQIRVAEGRRLSDPEIGIANQASVTRKGYAIQCRITTEDPEQNFLPDTGTISAYRAAAGFGIRLDSGTGGLGTVITGDYDSMIVKMTAWALDFGQAGAKALRSLKEFRIRGVKTNIPFLENVLRDTDFLSGRATTRFIDETPALTQIRPRKDRGSKLLRALSNRIVNGTITGGKRHERPLHFWSPVAPPSDIATPPPMSPAMGVFRETGAEGLSRWLREESRLQITDTSFRDAHQSLLATRVRAVDLRAVAPATARLASNLFSVEMWGGATFDVAYRFLREDPWERLARLREDMPNLLLQMLLRGANGVGYTNYPDNVIRRFVRESAATGVDIFRIFDALNWIPNMEIAIEEVAKAGKIAETSICYTGDLSDPTRTKYTLDYYVDVAQKLAERGAHILAIKDMAGLLKPAAAKTLVKALREATPLPVHLHTHDTSGNGVAMLLAASEAGVDAVDVALSSVSGLTSQPSLNALCAALSGTERDPGLDSGVMQSLSDYWESVREMYAPFESGLRASTADVYRHEIPGGQYSNFRPRAIELGLGHRWREIKEAYREVNLALGDLVKVTPTSKVVADFAMFLVQNDLNVESAIEKAPQLDFPKSVVDFMAGRLGQPYGGFPERLQKAVLKGHEPLTVRAGSIMEDHDFTAAALRLEEGLGRAASEQELLTDALYPKVFADYVAFTEEYGEVDQLPTPTFLFGLEVGECGRVEIEPGKTLVVRLMAVGGINEEGERTVHFELNGQPRAVSVLDESVSEGLVRREKGDPNNPLHLSASMPGKIVSISCAVGDLVDAGQSLVVGEAMKMETAMTATVAGKVVELLGAVGDKVDAGDLLVRLEAIN